MIWGTVQANLKFPRYDPAQSAYEWRPVVALGGTIAEQVGGGLGKLVEFVPRLGIGLRSAGRLLSVVGRWAGMGGALIAFDFKQAWTASREGNYGAGVAYALSGLLGIGAALCLMVGWTGIGLILVALLIAVAVIIEYIKDNKMQEWLKRCVWGNLTNERYRTLDQELEQLKVAAAG